VNPKLHQVYLSLGSNVEAEVHLPEAMKLLRETGRVKAVSRVWESKSVGFEGTNFLNACIIYLTLLPGSELKEKIIRPIEAKLGRIRSTDKNAPRTIDIDIVLYDEPPLNLEFWEYAFVTVPLAELIPDFEHPTRHEKLIQAAEQLQGQVWIVPRGDVLIS